MKRLFLLLALFICAVTHAQETVTDSVLVSTQSAAFAEHVYGDTTDANTTERILFFNSDIHIDTTGWVTVTETIRVYANQEQIQRGIFRSIPLYRAEKTGRKKRINIEVKEVLRDGRTENYHTKEKDGSLYIYCGSSDVYLEPGKYTYTITYASRGHVGFFDNYDELYWNITGNNWNYEIQGAVARFHLPPGAVQKQHACYTGEKGSTANDCTMQPDANGNPVFYSNKALAPQEGFTAAVGWQTGLIQRPPPPGMWERLKDEGGNIFGVLGLGYLLFFFYTRWKQVGRDAQKQVVVPVYAPPYSWSPAVMRFIYKRKIDDIGYTAAFIQMAVKKVIRIKEVDDDKNVFKLEKATVDTGALTAEEGAIYTSLLSTTESIRTSQGNYYKFNKARKDFEETLKEQVNLNDYYNANTKVWWHGTWRMLVWIVAYLALTEGLVSVPVIFLLPFLTGFLYMFIFGIRTILGGEKLKGILVSIFSLPFLGMCSLFLLFIIKTISTTSLTLLLIGLAAYTIYCILIPAYTQKGAEAKAAIAGFRIYLQEEKEHRQNTYTPQLFEQLLPYAIALDLVNEWAKKFEQVLTAAGYDPDWYDGDEDYTTFPSRLPRSLNRSLGTAGTNPNSGSSSSSGSSGYSSGSSGSGSSGGGGGGGGGGGW